MLRIEVPCQIRKYGRTLHDTFTELSTNSHPIQRALRLTKVTIIVVDEDGNATIRAILREPWLFLNVLADVDALENIFWFAVRLFQLFQYDGGLVT